MDKEKALDMALAQLEKQFGKNTVMRLGESPKQTVEAISTGSLALDLALGLGDDVVGDGVLAELLFELGQGHVEGFFFIQCVSPCPEVGCLSGG